MDILIVMETLFCFFLVCLIEDFSLRGYNLDVGNKQTANQVSSCYLFLDELLGLWKFISLICKRVVFALEVCCENLSEHLGAPGWLRGA